MLLSVWPPAASDPFTGVSGIYSIEIVRVFCLIESGQSETSDFSISSTRSSVDLTQTGELSPSPEHTVTLQRTVTMSRRGRSPTGFYQQPNARLVSETPPSLRWTHNMTPSSHLCQRCGDTIPTNTLRGGNRLKPTFARQNQSLSTTPPSTRPTPSSSQAQSKIGWTRSLTKR